MKNWLLLILFLVSVWLLLGKLIEKVLTLLSKKNAQNADNKVTSNKVIPDNCDPWVHFEEKIKKALKNKKEITINLSDLASIWMKHNLSSSELPEKFPENEIYEKITVSLTPQTPQDETQKLIDYLTNNAPDFIKTFFEKQILPIKESLILTKTFIPILQLLIFLSQKGIDCPSVIGENEKNELASYAFLEKVSLAEHSIHVAEEGLQLLREYFSDAFELVAGKALIAFLGHDIGKERAYRKLQQNPDFQYSTGDHPRFSAQVLNEIFLKEDIPGREEILYAVHRHHLSSANTPAPPLNDNKERLLWLLVQADRKAREKELLHMNWQDVMSRQNVNPQTQEITNQNTTLSRQLPSNSQTVTVKGIHYKDMFKKILPYVNKTITEKDISDPSSILPPETKPGNFLAVSQPDGIVYIRPDLIYYAFFSLVKEKQELIAQNAHILAKKKNEALIDIVNWLQDQKLIPPNMVQKGYIGSYFTFKMKDKEFVSFFLPVIASEAFDINISDLEAKRKKDPKTVIVHSFKKTSKPSNKQN